MLSQTSLTEEIKKSQSELDEFLIELDENFEGMQSTIIHLQTQLKECKSELASLKSSSSPSDLPPEVANGDHSINASNGGIKIKVEEIK